MSGASGVLANDATSTATSFEAHESFEIADMASDRGISREEAARRLNWQARATGLGERLSELAPEAFAGYWIDPADGDRLKVAVVFDRDGGQVQSIEEEIAMRGLIDAVDKVPVRNPLSDLRVQADRLQADARTADAGGRQSGVAIDERMNGLKLVLPSQPTSKQREFASQVQRSKRARVEQEDVTFVRQACSYSATYGISCGNPARGGTYIQTSEGEDCSYGLLVKSRSDGKLFLTTAGHCFTGLGVGVYGYDSSYNFRNYGNLHRKYNSTNGDMAIATINSAFDPRPRVVVNGSSDTVRDENYYISSDTRPRNGNRVCFTGGVSTRTDCGTVTNEAFYDSQTSQWFVRADYCDARGGDSGAPIYSGHTAYGIHTGAAAYCDNIFTAIDLLEPTLGVDVVHGTS